jgi:hypothetical protein
LLVFPGVISVQAPAILNVEAFAVEECCDLFLYLPPDVAADYDMLYWYRSMTSQGVISYGEEQVGPDGKSVDIGDKFIFSSNYAVNKEGFKICTSSAPNGGGVFIAGGTVAFSDSYFFQNL